MAVSLPNGTTMSLATLYATALAVSAITNANPAVCTAAAHDLEDGDLVEVTSGWSKLNNRIFRVSAATAGTFALEGADTASTALFRPGAGRVSVRKIETREQIDQVIESTSSGGEMGFTEVAFLADDFSSQLPTQASAQSIALNIADDPSLPGYKAIQAAAQTRAQRALIAELPSGSLILYNAIVSLNETPTFTKGQVMAVTATFSLKTPPVRYAA